MTLTCLDLFSGIGGFALGFDRAGIQTTAFCECEPYARRVLAKHWPTTPIYEDVRTLNAARLAADGITSPDIICGGFPCQDISLAGRGAGLAGERSGLWFEFARLIEEVHPSWVVAENVAALRSRGLDEVLRSLSQIGYDAEWHCIPASAIGAPHRRDRIWIVAYPERSRRQGLVNDMRPPRGTEEASAEHYHEAFRSGGTMAQHLQSLRDDDGLPLTTHRHRLRVLGNAVVPKIPELIGRAIVHQST